MGINPNGNKIQLHIKANGSFKNPLNVSFFHNQLHLEGCQPVLISVICMVLILNENYLSVITLNLFVTRNFTTNFNVSIIYWTMYIMLISFNLLYIYRASPLLKTSLFRYCKKISIRSKYLYIFLISLCYIRPFLIDKSLASSKYFLLYDIYSLCIR
jgi:hypothetical protein